MTEPVIEQLARRAGWVLALVALALYAPSLDNGFQYDDRHSIVDLRSEQSHIIPRSIGCRATLIHRVAVSAVDPRKALV